MKRKRDGFETGRQGDFKDRETRRRGDKEILKRVTKMT